MRRTGTQRRRRVRGVLLLKATERQEGRASSDQESPTRAMKRSASSGTTLPTTSSRSLRKAVAQAFMEIGRQVLVETVDAAVAHFARTWRIG